MNELIERYIYAVTRHLPQKQRTDVEQELESLISDMLDARCGAITPEEKDVRVVLTELGSPWELAAKYAGEEKKALISGEYFLIYKRVLKIVLPIAAAAVAFAGILNVFSGAALEGGALQAAITMMAQSIGGAFGGLLQAFAIITFIFAVLERKKVKFNEGDFISSLPQVPKTNARIKPGEPISGMVMCVVMTLVFIGFPQIIGGSVNGSGWFPLFDTQAVRSVWFLFVLWAVLGIGKEIVRLIEGCYTRRVLIVTVAADLLTLGCAAGIFLQSRLINPDFGSRLIFLAFEEPALKNIFAHFNLFIFGAVVFALAIDIVTTTVKTLKYDR